LDGSIGVRRLTGCQVAAGRAPGVPVAAGAVRDPPAEVAGRSSRAARARVSTAGTWNPSAAPPRRSRVGGRRREVLGGWKRSDPDEPPLQHRDPALRPGPDASARTPRGRPQR